MRGASRSSVMETDLTESRNKAECPCPQQSPNQETERHQPDAGAVDDSSGIAKRPALPCLIINEIGLGLAPVPSLSSGQGRQETTDDAVNVIEFLNPSDSPTETHALTVEFVNPARALIRLEIPDGILVPAGGSLAICQPAGLDADPMVFTQVLDVKGFVLNSATIVEAAFWDLGSDATEGLAVNLVCQAGGGDETGIDTFVANLKRPDLTALSSPLDFGVASRSKRISSENFETYFAGLSTVPNIFSRVFTGSAETLPGDTSVTQTQETIESTETVAPEGPEGTEDGAIVKVSGQPNDAEAHSRKRHRGRGRRRFGGKASGLQKPGSGGFRSGV